MFQQSFLQKHRTMITINSLKTRWDQDKIMMPLNNLAFESSERKEDVFLSDKML